MCRTEVDNASHRFASVELTRGQNDGREIAEKFWIKETDVAESKEDHSCDGRVVWRET